MRDWTLEDGTKPTLICDMCGNHVPVTIHGICGECATPPATTQKPATLSVRVEQVDRDAAADAVKSYRGQKNGDWQARIRRGECDDGEMVQAFARHRQAALAEAAGRLSEHWLTGTGCDKDAGTNQATCACSQWIGPVCDSQQAAVESWIEHAIDRLAAGGEIDHLKETSK